MPATMPPGFRTWYAYTVGCLESARQALLYVVSQCLVRGKLSHFGTPGATVSVPLCGGGSIGEASATSGGIAVQFP